MKLTLFFGTGCMYLTNNIDHVII